jgi:hypothetical protein
MIRTETIGSMPGPVNSPMSLARQTNAMTWIQHQQDIYLRSIKSSSSDVGLHFPHIRTFPIFYSLK